MVGPTVFMERVHDVDGVEELVGDEGEVTIVSLTEGMAFVEVWLLWKNERLLPVACGVLHR